MKNEIIFVKSVYGKKAFDNIDTVKYLDQVIVG